MESSTTSVVNNVEGNPNSNPNSNIISTTNPITNSTANPINNPVTNPITNPMTNPIINSHLVVAGVGEVPVSKPKKSKKKKNKLGVAAPRQPLTGYVRYSNSRRDNLRNDNPNLSFPDITKIIAQEWANLPPEEKRRYQEAGEQDRERYLQEMETYKKTDAYKDYLRKQEESKQKGKDKSKEKEPEVKRTKVMADMNEESNSSGFDIPIFTEEFLDLNKSREAELRQLRKSSTDYELQNASLSRIVDSMKTAVTSLESEINAQRANNLALSRHLEQLRASLAAAFHAVALPDSNERPTVDSIDTYMQNLHTLFTGSSAHQHSQLLARVSGIVERLDLHG